MRRTLALLISALALAACGGDDGNTTVQDPNPDPTVAGEAAEDTAAGGATAQGTVEIVMKDFAFEPSTAQVKVGQEVTWRNEGSAQHNAVSEEGNLETPTIGQGETAEFTPEEPGTINYICTIHPQMKGTLEVADQ